MSPEVAVIFLAQDDRVVPVDLIEAIAGMEQAGIRHRVYIPARAKKGSLRQAFAQTLEEIQAEEVFVCFLNENHYLASASLLLLVFCLEYFTRGPVHVCLPALNLFAERPVFSGRFVWHAKKLTQVLGERWQEFKTVQPLTPEMLADVSARYGYKGQIVSVLWSAGCGHRCSFCFSRDTGEEPDFRAGHHQERLIFLLEFARLTRAVCFKFRDPDFLGVPSRAWEAVQTLEKVAPGMPFRCNARLEDLAPEVLARLAESGCSQVFCGVEHVSSRLVKAAAKNEKVLGLLSQVLAHRPDRMAVALSFLAGLPGETLQEARDNLNLVKKLIRIKGVKPYLGYYVLFAKDVRARAHSDSLLACLNFSALAPEEMFLDYRDYCFLLDTVKNDDFFGFFSGALNKNSTDIIRMLLRELGADARLSECMPMARKLLLLRPDLAGRVLSGPTKGASP